MAHSCEMNGIHIPTLPLYFKGQVVRGFGRGSRTLGFPTANLDPKCFADKLTTSDEGVYFGWSRLNNEEPIEQMVMSIGYNPQFGNQTKTVVRSHLEYNSPWDLSLIDNAERLDNSSILLCPFAELGTRLGSAHPKRV
jgi:hypothetical protein